ncbi:DNA-processing protein DprA [Tissierella carlieri]|uniref:DNA-processing protein DprA n=1 Tax=Tissierella carlieri TaxID=689904 RepID=UPI001C10E657|nr:DNA-processing protein DprA [Tissierella carlieri]MBU5314216.1 DNA-processing protein DprA [Tissierella carlieri]
MNITQRDILIWLSSLGIGNVNIGKIIDHFYDLRDLWELNSNQFSFIKNLNNEVREKLIHNRNNEYIKRLFDNIEKENVHVITIYDENYPTRLRYINDSPRVIYVKGNIIEEDSVAIAIVGSRKATTYGKWACEKFTKELANLGVTIISGLASGIDTIAHKTALDNGARTIGVLGNGIDIVYPKKNLFLYNDIEKNGGIVSEFPLGTPPLAFNFPQRNRIISGLSMGVIVVEAQEKSGSLITAHHALEQGKDIFALPGNINSIFSGGTNKLIKDGAKPLLEIDDIIEEINELQEKLILSKKDGLDYSNYSETEIKIIKFLEEGPLHSDNIAYKMGIDIVTLNSILTILELKGSVKELSGRVFTIC